MTVNGFKLPNTALWHKRVDSQTPQRSPTVTVQAELLRNFSSLRLLRAEALVQLARQAQLVRYEPRSLLFELGERTNHALFLVQGTVQLEDAGGKPVRRLQATRSQVNDGLELDSPHRHTARCLTEASCIRVDSALLEITMSWDQTSSAASVELQELGRQTSGDDWMMRLLQTRRIGELPAEHLQALFLAMQVVEVPERTRLIAEGDAGDYFYVIDEGECSVLRERPGAKPLLIARFGRGECFGEEALISGEPRNATVVASKSSRLRRLDRASFLKLLNEPMTRSLDFESARQRVAGGKARWLDVRPNGDPARARMPDSIDVPAHWLRSRSTQLDPALQYICVCDNGLRSRVATFLLQQRGFEAYGLVGGLQSLGR